MNALVLTAYSKLQYLELPTPLPLQDEVLIKIKACAICGSDIHGFLGHSERRIPPIIMGHEASGIIEAVGSCVSDSYIGERVTFDSTEYCGQCTFCRTGKTNLCQNRKIAGVSCTDYIKQGAMAEYITIKEHCLYRIPDSISFKEACLAEPLSVAIHAVRLSSIMSGKSVVVIGDGTIGLMTIYAVRAAGAELIILSAHKKHPPCLFHCRNAL